MDMKEHHLGNSRPHSQEALRAPEKAFQDAKRRLKRDFTSCSLRCPSDWTTLCEKALQAAATVDVFKIKPGKWTDELLVPLPFYAGIQDEPLFILGCDINMT